MHGLDVGGHVGGGRDVGHGHRPAISRGFEPAELASLTCEPGNRSDGGVDREATFENETQPDQVDPGGLGRPRTR